MSQKITLAIHKKDPRKESVKKVLEPKGCEILEIQDGENAPENSVAFFTYMGEDFHFPCRHLRMAAHHFQDHVPEWAKTTPFTVMMRPEIDPGDRYQKMYWDGFREAITKAARTYQEFFQKKTSGNENGKPEFSVPWISGKKQENQLPNRPTKEELASNEVTRFSLLESWKKRLDQFTFPEKFELIENLVFTKAKRKKLEKGKGWGVAKRKVQEIKDVTLTNEQRLREAIIVASIGAFNFGVGMSLDDSRLHKVYLETVKRLALVAEQGGTGGGAHLYKLISTVKPENIFIDMLIDQLELGEDGITPSTHETLEISREAFLESMKNAMEYVAPNVLTELKKTTYQEIKSGKTLVMSIYPQIEAILTYGKPYDQLNPEQQEICKRYQMCDEFKHFSRIMDPDAIIETKKVVGTADAGNPRIARLLLYGADNRKRLGIYQPLPMPGRILVEEAQFKNPLAPTFVRKNAPYIGVVVTASDSQLAKDMIDIMRKLVSQHPLEVCIAMLEDWLMAGKPDNNVSVTAFQLHNTGSHFLIKAMGIGGGTITIDDTIFHFPKGGREYGNLEVGRMDFQHPLHQHIFQVQEGDVIQAIAPNTNLENLEEMLKKPVEGGVARLTVNPRTHEEIKIFEWTEKYASEQLIPLTEAIVNIEPETVRIQFGHVHSDRDAGPEQESAGFMTRVLCNDLAKEGVGVTQIEPMIDNLHVVDRIDVKKFMRDMTNALGVPGKEINEIAFEASLLTRRLGDEMIIKLYQLCPAKIVNKGHNVYLQVDANMMIELYDGVGEKMENPGRQGCVPWEGGYEIRRLSPALASKIWKEIIFDQYPDSIVAKWWEQDPNMDFEHLTYKHIYQQNPQRRAALKRQLDEEIDRPYREKILNGNTEYLDRILAEIPKAKQVFMHFLEGAYDGQHTKFANFMRLCGVLPMNIFRISFDRHSGKVVILDVNDPLNHLK